MWLIDTLATGFGLPAPQQFDDARAWPNRSLALAFTPTAARSWSTQGWRTIPVGSTFASTVEAVVSCARELGVDVDPSIAMRRAVGLVIAAHGVKSAPHVSRDGRAVSWLDQRIAVVLPGGAVGPLRKAGFSVFNVGAGTVDDALTHLRATALALLAAASSSEATNPSSHEQRLMKSMLAAGLPAPMRGLRLLRDDGSVYSQPDFAWPDARLIVDLDGWYFHAADALDIILQHSTADAAQTALRLADRVRFDQDARKRRQAAVEGWTVLTVSDIEIDRDGPQPSVRQIIHVYQRLVASTN